MDELGEWVCVPFMHTLHCGCLPFGRNEADGSITCSRKDPCVPSDMHGCRVLATGSRAYYPRAKRVQRSGYRAEWGIWLEEYPVTCQPRYNLCPVASAIHALSVHGCATAQYLVKLAARSCIACGRQCAPVLQTATISDVESRTNMARSVLQTSTSSMFGRPG